jgi:hypothetical protein
LCFAVVRRVAFYEVRIIVRFDEGVLLLGLLVPVRKLSFAAAGGRQRSLQFRKSRPDRQTARTRTVTDNVSIDFTSELEARVPQQISWFGCVCG